MSESLFVTCAHCAVKNRIPENKLNAGPKCGKCKEAVIAPSPLALTDNNFQHFIQNNDLPVIVDFWASWCGPCQMMAPIFADASAQMSTQIRFAKVDTEQAQQTAGAYQIRSIPSLIIYKGGKEVARQAGAMDKTNLINWIKSVI